MACITKCRMGDQEIISQVCVRMTHFGNCPWHYMLFACDSRKPLSPLHDCLHATIFLLTSVQGGKTFGELAVK